MLKNREIYLIFGKTGSGKSVLTRLLLKKLNYKRIIIIDPQLEYDEGIIFYSLEDLIYFHEKNNPENFIYVCRFTNDIDEDMIFKWIYIEGNICLVIDEADNYISPTTQSSNFMELVKRGRHKAISIIGITRTPTELNSHFRAQVDEIITFKQTEPIYIDKMENYGFEGVENLEQFDYVKDLGIPKENIHYLSIRP